jgi:hypothetical protein
MMLTPTLMPTGMMLRAEASTKNLASMGRRMTKIPVSLKVVQPVERMMGRQRRRRRRRRWRWR